MPNTAIGSEGVGVEFEVVIKDAGGNFFIAVAEMFQSSFCVLVGRKV